MQRFVKRYARKRTKNPAWTFQKMALIKGGGGAEEEEAGEIGHDINGGIHVNLEVRAARNDGGDFRGG